MISSQTTAQEDKTPPDEAAPGEELRFIDIEYVENGHPQQKLDLYLPHSGNGPWPVIVWIHGGGWFMGSKDNCLPLEMGFLDEGFAIASIDYQLTGVAPFPAQIQDVKAAVRWLRKAAADYSLDPDRFIAWGDSAGGHLAALLGTSAGEKSFSVGANLDQSESVAAVCDFYGPTEFISFVQTPGYESHAAPNSPESRLMGAPVLDRPDLANKLSPLTYIDPSDPPFLIIHGSKDTVVPVNQSEQLASQLNRAGVPVLFEILEEAKHGGPAFSSDVIKQSVLGFINTSLYGGPPHSNLEADNQ
ncbi:alpha/beta hydrolase [Pelagicoccus sp. SDUM812002]|uniref:alpha/beta hydrolase n=1 Tax=Pelagicoccus sp. SDUM812002 TaxID=3041266 RepID=UPI00280D1C9B|nr:alpha/beta hydrolase [Pelagicoccus sp. SDUM812002]MDQ8186553.1 alpha/beta hydrolase [Pelagicoccus sp. SDUM812002]